jgi:hypothetical protein
MDDWIGILGKCFGWVGFSFSPWMVWTLEVDLC